MALMETVQLGIIRETKTPPDKRVPLTPKQCKIVEELFPHVKVTVQSSPIRCFSDDQYRQEGITVQEDMSHCDILMGVKEVKIDQLIPGKRYFFFSHTIKEQPYNRELFRAIVEKKIELIDYEILTDKDEKRIIGFGRYAGIVGCYNGFLTFGKKHGYYSLKPANQCEDKREFLDQLKNVKLPSSAKIILTGFGRVGNGAREIVQYLKLKEVSPEDFLSKEFDEPVFTHLKVQHYYSREDGQPFDKGAFFENGEGHVSTFKRYMQHADMYIACHYWDSSSPFIFTREDLKDDSVKTSVVADISCDIDGPIACTLRPSSIADPIYGYDPHTESESSYLANGNIAVMAVDNLPCELPKDASEDFGNELIDKVFPFLFGDDPDRIIERATETDLHGNLKPDYAYLQDYLQG